MARITREKTKERDYEDRSYDRGGDDYGKYQMNPNLFGRRKQCRFSADQDYVIDYKDVEMMLTLISASMVKLYHAVFQGQQLVINVN